MATFLSLCNDVARESGTMGQGIATVTGATGRTAKVIAWTRQAWEMIQRERTDWTFRKLQFEDILVPGETSYSASDFGIDDFGGWLNRNGKLPLFTIYDTEIGRGDEQPLCSTSLTDWLYAYDIGAPDRMRPRHFAVGNNGELRIGPPADKSYAIRGWYKRAIQSLTEDSDEPFIHEGYHQMIVWRALILLGEDDEGQVEIATSTMQFRSIYRKFVNEFTPDVVLS